jgi:hypothetical protein
VESVLDFNFNPVAYYGNNEEDSSGILRRNMYVEYSVKTQRTKRT